MDHLSTDQWQKIKALFDEAVGLDVAKRHALLDRACADEPEIRREVESLLEGDTEELPFLNTGIADYAGPILSEKREPNSDQEIRDMRGQRIGVWRLVEEIGRGGMGVVYRTERADGAFEQTVALKLIKRGMDSEAILARFLNERQVLASLRHPHIARLIDGGVVDDGTPWFAMEYVEGVPITDYCNEHGLAISDRLDLFIKVCRAVEHAHNRLIIHRDLKPSNILVTKNGNPRLLDFGLAKVLQDPAGDPSTTQREQRWMTLDYASPEQMRGDPVGTPSDTYQLGLILYELLTGKRAYTVKGLSPTEAERVICEIDPPKPSTAVVSDDGVASQRAATLQGGRLPRSLKGDLDTIVMKALHKDPARGYASAETMATDIERYLEGLPILARPDTVGYRARKFVSRHRAGVAVAAGVTLLVTALIGFYTLRLQDERDRARLEATKAEEVIGYITGIFKANDPAVAQGDTITVREVLERGVAQADLLDDQPELQATLFAVTAEVYYNLDNLDEAEALYRRALAVWDANDKRRENEEAYTRGLLELGRTIAKQDRYEESESILRQVIEDQRIRGTDDDLLQGALFDHYSVLHAMGHHEAAEEAFSAWEASFSRADVTPDPETADRMIALGKALGYRGEIRGEREALQRGETVVRRALSVLRGSRGPQDPSVAKALNVLSNILLAETSVNSFSRRHSPSQVLAIADSVTDEAVVLHRTIYSEPNSGTWAALNNRATVLMKLGRLTQAEETARLALGLAEETMGRDASRWFTTRKGLGWVLLRKAEFEEAEEVFREVRDWWAKTYGRENLFTLTAALGLGQALIGLGRYDEAEAELLWAYETLENQRGRQNPDTQSAIRHLVHLYEIRGKPEEAAKYRTRLEGVE